MMDVSRTYNTTLNVFSTAKQQYLLDNKIVKSVDIVQYDRTLITASLWHHIASHALIAFNDTHISQLIRHTYQRHDIHKQLNHNMIVHESGTTTRCTNTDCYKLAYDTNNTQLIQLHSAAVQRGLGLRQTRLIFQQSIISQHLWPCATVSNVMYYSDVCHMQYHLIIHLRLHGLVYTMIY